MVTTMGRIWREIEGFRKDYVVSDDGLVFSKIRKRLLKQRKNNGYMVVKIGNLPVPVHKLVAIAYIGTRPVGMEVRHLDGNILNNEWGNLAYGTHKQNMEDKTKHGKPSWSVLNMKCAEEIRRLRSAGMKLEQLSEIFCVSTTTIKSIISMKTWRPYAHPNG